MFARSCTSLAHIYGAFMRFAKALSGHQHALACSMAWLHNRWSDKTISIKDSIVVWWAGMMRGAVSVAMVYYRFDPNNQAEDKHAATIVVTTLQLVLYSTVGLGGVTGPLLKLLLPQVRDDHGRVGPDFVACNSESRSVLLVRFMFSRYIDVLLQA